LFRNKIWRQPQVHTDGRNTLGGVGTQRFIQRGAEQGLLRVGLRPNLTKDLYHRTLRLPWSGFLLLMTGVYLVANLAFAFLYWLQPGAIANARPGFFRDAFFFSVETFGTIGYGTLAPATDYANVVMTVETLCGIVLVALTAERHGIDGVILATAMAGVFLVAAGLLRLVTYIKFLPYPVTVGFTAGIAVIIFASQLRDLLGITLTTKEPGELIPKLEVLARSLHTVNVSAVAIAAGSIAALALIAGVLIQLGQNALIDIVTWGIAVVALAILLRFKINSAWLIAGGAVIGVIRFLVVR